MFRHGEIRTETDRKPFIFTLIACAVSLTAAVLLFVLAGDGLGIFAGILLAIVGLAAGAVLFAMVTDRAYIEEGVLTMRYLFKKTQIPLAEIGKISLKDNVYSVFDQKEKLAGTMNAQLTGIGVILHALDQNKVPFV